MQNTSFTTEILSIKSRGTMQTWSGLNKSSSSKEFTDTSYWHPTLLTDTQIHSYTCAWSKDRQNTEFLQKSLLPSHPALISGSDLENRIASKWGAACAWNSATSPTSLWHGFHYTVDVAFLLSLSSFFPLSNDFFDHLDRLGQQTGSSSVLHSHVKRMHWIC